MKNISFVISFLIISILFSCKTSSEPSDNSNLSSFNADNFKITSFKGGGMLPVSENFSISKSESFWKYTRYRNETIVNWTTSEEELKEIYTFLKKHKYAEITSKSEGEVYDRGGITYTITNGKDEVKIDNSGSNFINEKWAEDFKAIRKKLEDFVHTKVYNNKINVSMETTAEVSEAIKLYEITVYVDEEKGLDTESDEINPAPTFKVFNGLNKVYVSAFYRDSVGTYGERVAYSQDQLFLTADKSTSKLKLDFVDGIFTVEFKD